MDIEQLRKDLMDYYGTAMSFMPMAVMDLAKIENASDDELIRIAKKNGFDLSKYEEIYR